MVGAGEAYVGLYFMGHAIAWSDALILESIAFALRTAAFVVPARLGIQEGGYILLGAMFGLSPEVALALSLVEARARDRHGPAVPHHLAERRVAAAVVERAAREIAWVIVPRGGEPIGGRLDTAR